MFSVFWAKALAAAFAACYYLRWIHAMALHDI